MLDLVDLGYKRDALVTSLSRGMTQRLGLARVLLHEPQVLLLDELMAGLPPQDAEEMMAVIREIRRRGVTLVIIEHVMNVIVSLCNRVLVLHQGRKIADGPVRDVLRDKGVLAAYLGRAFTEEVLDRRGGADGGAG